MKLLFGITQKGFLVLELLLSVLKDQPPTEIRRSMTAVIEE